MRKGAFKGGFRLTERRELKPVEMVVFNIKSVTFFVKYVLYLIQQNR